MNSYARLHFAFRNLASLASAHPHVITSSESASSDRHVWRAWSQDDEMIEDDLACFHDILRRKIYERFKELRRCFRLIDEDKSNECNVDEVCKRLCILHASCMH